MIQPTRKLYYEDVMRKSFCAEVLACEKVDGWFRAALTATVFYPEGGGQPADRGILGGAGVVGVHEENGVIWHTVTTRLTVGETVQGDIDWSLRLDHMQQHTGEHIVSGIVHALYGYDNVGFHIGADAVRLDFSGPLTSEQLFTVEHAANWIVWQNEPVCAVWPRADELATLIYRSKKELTGEVRIVSAGSADTCACCGTHVRSCAEVGMVKLLSAQSYKGGTRVLMAAGVRAYRDYCEKSDSVNEISVLLSAKPADTAAAVRRLAQEQDAHKEKIARLETLQFAQLAQQAVQRGETLLLLDEAAAPDAVRRCCIALCDAWVRADEKSAGGGAVAPHTETQAQAEKQIQAETHEQAQRAALMCAVFAPRCGQSGAGGAGSADSGLSYALAAASGDVRETGKALNAALNGRGGGKSGLVQGSVEADAKAVRAFWRAQASR